MYTRFLDDLEPSDCDYCVNYEWRREAIADGRPMPKQCEGCVDKERGRENRLRLEKKEKTKMKYELKPCPFCGGTVTFEEEFDRKYAKDQREKGESYFLNTLCSICGNKVVLFSKDLEDPDDIDTAVDLLIEKANRRVNFEKHPTVYIAGAIKNDPDYKEKFAAAAALFREKGFDVINPAETVLDKYAGYKDYIDHGLAQEMTADVVCDLEVKVGFISSDGAGLECRYADTVGIPIIRATYDREKKEVTLG